MYNLVILEKITWREKKNNEEIFRLVGEDKCMLEVVIDKSKKAWIGHVVRGDGLLKLTLVIERRMEGKRLRGRPRIGMIDDIMMGSYKQMKRRALDREGCRGWVPRICQAQRTVVDDDDDEGRRGGRGNSGRGVRIG